MQTLPTTPASTPNGVRRPFGPLFESAMRNLPNPDDNSQRDDFLKDKPSVFGTLYRFGKAEIEAGATREQWEEFCNTLHLALLDEYDRMAEPNETLAESYAMDAAAEGVECVAQIDAIADPTPGRLQSAYRRINASLSAKRRALRTTFRDFNRSVAR